MDISDYSDAEDPVDYASGGDSGSSSSLPSDHWSKNVAYEEDEESPPVRRHRNNSKREHRHQDDRSGQEPPYGQSAPNGPSTPYYGPSPPNYGQPAPYYPQTAPYYDPTAPGREYAGPPEPFWPPPTMEWPRPPAPFDYPRSSPPVQPPGFWEPQRSKFWDELDRFESGVEEQAGKSLVAARRPWAPYPSQPTYRVPKAIESNAPDTAEAPVAAGPNSSPRGEPGPAVPQAVDATTQRDADHSVRVTQTYPRHPLKQENRRKRQETALAGTSEGLSSLSPIANVKTATTRVDLVHDPSQAIKDMSMRLELDVEEDWDDDLEEFCRLRRLGLIKEAREQFRSTLEHLSGIPYIWVQYAEMLLSCGDYKSLQSLKPLPEFSSASSVETPDGRIRQKLAINYALLDVLSQRPARNYLTSAWGLVQTTLNNLASEATAGSTEVRRKQLVLYPGLCLTVCQRSNSLRCVSASCSTWRLARMSISWGP